MSEANEPVMKQMMDLTLAGDTFKQLRRNFDIVMQRMMKAMQDTKSDEAKITVSVDVKLDNVFVAMYDKSGNQDGGRDVKKPTFKHKVVSTISVKDEESGTNNTEMELVWDEKTKTYILVPIRTQQMTFDDFMKEKEKQEQEKTAMIEGSEVPLLPDGIDDGYVYDEPEPDDDAEGNPES